MFYQIYYQNYSFSYIFYLFDAFSYIFFENGFIRIFANDKLKKLIIFVYALKFCIFKWYLLSLFTNLSIYFT